MSRVSSLVMVRVAAEVAFFTTRSLVDVRRLVVLPLTFSLTQAPRMAASVDVTADITAFSTLDMMPGFCFSALAGFSHLEGTLALYGVVVLAVDAALLDDVQTLTLGDGTNL